MKLNNKGAIEKEKLVLYIAGALLLIVLIWGIIRLFPKMIALFSG